MNSTAVLHSPPTAAEVAEAPPLPVATHALRGHPWALFTAGLVALDTLALCAAFAVAYVARFKAGLPLVETPPHALSFYSSLAFWSIPVWLIVFAVYGLYTRHVQTDYSRIANACTAGLVVEVLFSFFDTSLSISRGWLLLTWLFCMVMVSLGRMAAGQLLRALHARGLFCLRAIVVGTNEEAFSIADQLLANPRGGISLVGFVDAEHPVGTIVHANLPVIGRPEALAYVVPEQAVSEVIVASTAVTRDQLLELYRSVGQDSPVHLRLSSGLWEILTTGVRVHEVNRVPLITPERLRITGVDAVVKTCIDYLAAACGLILLSPFLVGIALLIHFDSPGPVIHRRRVLGVSGTAFDAFKFRTMIEHAERRHAQLPIKFQDRRSTFKSSCDPRVTRAGRLLRKTSLDELPQLVNVLRGEMSLVGPRMIAPDEQPLYGRWQHNLLTVKPGITGPWQVQGRGDIPYAERVRLSMHYIRNYSLWLDLEILLRTFLVVLRGKGAY
jgi:exopolysaccharide biosynthesis polyprenyl glycosylphosphotransferase